MSTKTRPELSKKNKYYIPRHRYYELKHFVMQYPEWDLYLSTITGDANTKILIDAIKSGNPNDPVLKAVIKRDSYRNNIKLCNTVAYNTDPFLGREILGAIITGEGYDKYKARQDTPCCKETWYNLYRKFFYLLDAARK